MNAAYGLRINHLSPVPLHRQLAVSLEQAIRTGTIGAGQRLDGELHMARDLGMSRPTVRQAIQVLVDRGLLVRRPGRGTHVVSPSAAPPKRSWSLYDDLSDQHRTPATRVLLQRTATLQDWRAAWSSIRCAGPPQWNSDLASFSADPAAALGVLELRRLRFADGRPAVLMENYLPASIGPFDVTDLTRRGLYELLQQRNVIPRVARQYIGARTATPEEMDLLDNPPGGVVLTVHRAACTNSGGIIEIARHVYRSDRYLLPVTSVGAKNQVQLARKET